MPRLLIIKILDSKVFELHREIITSKEVDFKIKKMDHCSYVVSYRYIHMNKSTISACYVNIKNTQYDWQ